MLEVRLFGTPEIRSEGKPVVLASGRAQTLLAHLVLRRGAWQRREHLAHLIWPDSTEKQARTNLRHVLHTLRAAIPHTDRFLRSTPHALSWGGSWSDVAAFEAALAQADGRGEDEAVGRLREAVDLYAGDLLQGWYDDWLVPERDRLRRQVIAALDRLLPMLEARGELDTAIGYGERARALDPLAEAAYRGLIRLYDARGDRARALRVYHECVRMLEDEPGVKPSEATRAAYEALLPAAAGGAPPAAPGPTGATPFVGRYEERRRLTGLWHEARRGRAQLALVTGEPGIGKTRLVEELRAWCAHRGAATAFARSYAVEGGLAYAPVVAWLREPDIIGRWRGRLGPGHLAALSRLLPEIPPAPEAGSRLRLFEAVVRALLAGPGPVLLVADDLHAADRPTLQLLHYLLRAEPGAPLLVVATARLSETDAADPLRELVAGLGALDRCRQIELERLGPTETAALAERLAQHRLSSEQVDRIYAGTAGNPLFVVETVRAGWPSHGDADVLTPRMHAVLEARLQQLTPGARDLLGLVATAGSSISVDVLGRIDGGEELVRDLDELWRRQLLLSSGADTYDFSHDKLREVAYAALGPVQRRRNHRTLARALRETYAEGPDAVAGRVAAHLAGAGEVVEASSWYERAAAAARRVYADADAALLLEKALDLVRSMPEARERQEHELRLLTALPGPLAVAEGYASARLGVVVDRALDLARQLGVEPAAPLLRAVGMAVLSRGDVEAALEIGGRLRARGATDPVSAVEGGFVQGVAAYWRGELAVARTHLEAAVAAYRPEDRSAHLLLFGQDPQVLCVARLAHVHFFLGDPVAARRAQRASLDLAREARHPFTLAVGLLFAALLDLELREFAALGQRVGELHGLQERVEAPPVRLVSDASAGLLDVVDSRTGPGLARIDAALADPQRDTAPGVPAMLLRIRLAACECAGDAERGLETAERLLAGDVRVWDAQARRAREVFRAQER